MGRRRPWRGWRALFRGHLPSASSAGGLSSLGSLDVDWLYQRRELAAESASGPPEVKLTH